MLFDEAVVLPVVHAEVQRYSVAPETVIDSSFESSWEVASG